MVYRKRTLKKKPMVSRRKTSLKSLVHKVMLKEEQPQYFSQSDNANYLSTMYHNQLYTWNIFNQNLWGQTIAGTGEFARTGDIIHVDSLRVKANIIAFNSAIGKTYIRILLVKANPVYAAATISATGLGSSDVFVGGTGNRANYTGICDPREVTVLYDKIIEVTQYATGQFGHHFDHLFKLNRKITYLPNTQTVKGQQYYFLVSAFQNGATSGVTPAISMSINSNMTFKNSL